MSVRNIVITGGSDGIGAAAARQLSRRGHRVILVGRSPEKTAHLATELGVEQLVADFSRLDDVRRLAADVRSKIDRLDVLANNAGALLGRRTLTRDGYEQTLQVNHLAPFLLTNLLLDLLQSGEGKVVNTSSASAKIVGRIDLNDLHNERAYTPLRAYGDSKLANILFTSGLHVRFGGHGIHSVAFDPGNARTNFASETTSGIRLLYRTPLARLALNSAENGGTNLAFFADGTPGEEWQAGQFYSQTTLVPLKRIPRQAADLSMVEKLWQRSAELVGLTPHHP
jgi:NAD(P)-dependent dehydrogenase (short-subunit alcohol dehydrogenase family)